MDYFKLLPPNVHEDIGSRLDLEKPFHIIKFAPRKRRIVLKRDQNENVNPKVKDVLLSNGRKYQPFIEKTIINYEYFEIDGNCFVSISAQLYKIFVFCGDNKIYIYNHPEKRDPFGLITKYSQPKIVYITSEVNQQLLQFLIAITRCSICKDGFDIKIDKGLVEATDCQHIGFFCGNSEEQRMRVTSHICSSYLGSIHKGCDKKCSQCNSFICVSCFNNRENYCKKCKCQHNQVEELREDPLCARCFCLIYK